MNLGTIIRQLYNKLKIQYTSSVNEKNLLIKHNLCKEINEARIFKVCTSNSIIGMEELILNIPKYFTVNISSKVIKYYAVPIEVNKNF